MANQAFFALLISFATYTAEHNNLQKETNYSQAVIAIDKKFDREWTIKKIIQSKFPDLFIKINQSKLKAIKHTIQKEEHNHIQSLLKENKLSKEEIKQTFAIIQIGLETRKKYLSQSAWFWTNATHDPELSEHIEIINAQLKKKGLNSNNINIIKENREKQYGGSNEQRSSYNYTYNLLSKTITSFTFSCEPDTISINSPYINHNHKEAIALHETEHSIRGHVTIQSLIEMCIKHFNGNSNADASKNYYRLQRIHEHQAEVFPSLRNAKAASLMRNRRRDGYYTNMLYDEHYYQLSEIDEIHKMIAHLQSAKKDFPSPTIQPINLSKFFGRSRTKRSHLHPDICAKC